MIERPGKGCQGIEELQFSLYEQVGADFGVTGRVGVKGRRADGVKGSAPASPPRPVTHSPRLRITHRPIIL